MGGFIVRYSQALVLFDAAHTREGRGERGLVAEEPVPDRAALERLRKVDAVKEHAVVCRAREGVLHGAERLRGGRS